MLSILRKLIVFSLFLMVVSPLYADNHTRQYTYNRQYMPILIESIAKSKLGKKYKWGGNGPYQYDCSGFTKEVFAKTGIRIPRVSRDQAKVAKRLAKINSKRGISSFFTPKRVKLLIMLVSI